MGAGQGARRVSGCASGQIAVFRPSQRVGVGRLPVELGHLHLFLIREGCGEGPGHVGHGAAPQDDAPRVVGLPVGRSDPQRSPVLPVVDRQFHLNQVGPSAGLCDQPARLVTAAGRDAITTGVPKDTVEMRHFFLQRMRRGEGAEAPSAPPRREG